METAAATGSSAGADTQIDAAAAKRRRRWAPDVLRFKTSRLIDLDALPNSEEEGPRTDPPHSSARRKRPKRPLLEDDGQLHDPMHSNARRRRVKRSLCEDLDAIPPPEPSADPEAVASSSMEIAEPVASGGQASQSLSAPSSSPGDPSVLSSDGANHSSLPAVALGDSTSSLQPRLATGVRVARHDLDENLPEPAPEVPEETEPAVEEPAAEEPAVEEPAAEEPAAEEPAAEEPAAEEPAAEEPAAEEPAAEEPAAEEPAAEEPVSGVREPAPEAIQPESAASEQAPEASEQAQGASGSAPEALEPAPEAPEPAPEAPEDAPMLPPAALSSYEPDAEPDAEPCPEPEMPSVAAQKARPATPSRPTRQLDPRLYDPVKPPRTPSSSSGAVPAASTTPAESTTASGATDQETSDQQAVPTATTTTAPTAAPASKLGPPIAPNTLTAPTQLRPPVRQLHPPHIRPPLSSQQPPPHIQHPAAGAQAAADSTLSDPAPYTPVDEGDDPSSSSGDSIVNPFTASTVRNNSLSVKARPPRGNPSQSSASSTTLPTSTTAKEPMAQAKAPETIAKGACVKSASPVTGSSDSLNGNFLSDQPWGLLVAAVRVAGRSGPRRPLVGPQPPGQQGAHPPAPAQAPLRPSWPAPALVPGLSAASVPSKSQQGMTAGLPCSVPALGKSQQAMAMPPHGSTTAPGKSQQVMLKSASFAASLSKTAGSAALSPPGHPSTNPPSNSIHPLTPATYPASSLGTRLSTAPVNTPPSTYPTMKTPTMQQTPSGCEAMPSQPLAPLTPLPPHMSASKPPPVAAPVPTPKPPPTQMAGPSAPVGTNGMTPATIPTTSPQMVKTSAPVPTSTPMTAPATPLPVSKNGSIPATAAATTTASSTNASSAAPPLLLAKAPETPAPGRPHTSDAGPHVVTAPMDADGPGPGVGGHARKSALRKRPNAPVVEVIELDLDDDEDGFQKSSSSLEPTPPKGVCVLSEPSPVKDFHMANEDEKVYLIEKMIAFPVADMDEERQPTVAIPPDGKFPGGLEQYAETWSAVVVEEAVALLRAELGRVLTAPGKPVMATPCREYPDSWELELLLGDWQGDNCWWSITLASDGAMIVSDGRNWHAQLGPPSSNNWRNASSGNREHSIRMRNWNTLEVYGIPALRRAPAEIRPGSIVLMTWPAKGSNQPPFHCIGTVDIATVELRRQSAVVRCLPDVATSRRSRCEVRPVNSGLMSFSRELKAVWGAASVPETLQEDLFGLKDFLSQKDPVPAGFERRAPAPCLKSLNASQLHAVEAACHMEAGFTLVWGPPGTGKSSMLVAMVNALHLREYERLHTAVERIVLGNSTSRSIDLQWHNAVRCAPRLLVTAGSNAAVQGLLNRVIEKNFLDRLGNVYEPWGIVRVGTAKEGVETSPVDLDSRVQALLRIPDQEIADRLRTVNMALNSLKSQVGKLHSDIKKLQEAVPLPVGWSAKISDSTDFVEYHDHLRKKATWVRPDPPPKGVACVQILDLPDAIRRLGELIKCADRWWQFEGEKERLSVLVKKGINSEGRGEKLTKAKLESSFLGRAHLVFATLNSAARLRPYAAQNEPFGAVVIDEAAQATEPSVLIPLQLARSGRCVLVGDDRQLPPTVFSQENCLISRPLFERLRLLGHRAELLEEQYRMAPEISAFPRSYFYGGLLKDAPGMKEKTRRAIHTVFPPLLFLDLGSSEAQRTTSNSWRNLEEARLVASLIAHLRTTVEELGESEITQDVGVVTPYKDHKELVSRELVRMHGNQDGVTVTTVDGFQGRECEVIIFSTVRAPDAQSKAVGIGFLSDERRLNVALTRARSLMIVVGHGRTLVQSRAWAALMEHVRRIPGAYQFVKSSRDVGDLWNTLVNQATMGDDGRRYHG